RTFRGDGPRRTNERNADGGTGFERDTRPRSADSRDRRGPASGGRQSRDDSPGRPARPDRSRGTGRGPERQATGYSRPPQGEWSPDRSPRTQRSDADSTAPRSRESGRPI